VRCDDVSELLAGAVDGTTVLDRRASRHVGACLRCQAELAHYRRLLRTLHQLRAEPVAVPADLPRLVFSRLDAAGRPAAWGRRVAYAGALAATAAGAAGAIALVANRNRRLRLAG
jgi:anti-sigma factor RsiW